MASLLADTYGVLFIGVSLSGVLLGIMCLQMYIFYKRFPQDTLQTKAAVATTGVLDVLTFALNLHGLYHTTFDNSANLLTILNPIWSFKISVLLSDLISSVQTMYCVRLWKFSKERRFMPVLVTVAAVVGWASALMNGIQT
ncbi:hypothetical protein PUNSTDRAFT_134355 [Punctularia strigosozonata HHB-11173 SS5]|uniref:uncharacterized protein n=1 Tax=Punctularia strigosozonata (strain HHB-11173) TaxID=741275 RepID=UPI00044176D4|nr:uncharacterized protein PUNSTDRAFT_134355 [Punctularia strigosozonata HHB-11173 SS5]EIN09190.1 hypothetical protein PUNSTDRAFT_134355 [Punctularia strigosozonata HHB-11173 SS5]